MKLNENWINFKDNSYMSQIETLSHEVVHALFFQPLLFDFFPKPVNQPNYLIQDNVYKLVGLNIIRVVRDHFGCPDFKLSLIHI